MRRNRRQPRTNIYSELLDISDDLTDCASLLETHTHPILAILNHHPSAQSFAEPGDTELWQIEEEAASLLSTADKVIATLRGFKRLRPVIRKLANSRAPYFELDE